MKTKSALVTSATAFSLALLLTITMHELAHAVAALALGFHPLVNAFSVDTGVATSQQHIITGLTGPIVSLVIGLLILAIPRRGGGFSRLLLLWLGLLGVQEFAGYLITAPFTSSGDIGAALKLAGAPVWLSLVLFAAGWVVTYFNGRYATRELIKLTNPNLPLAPQLRQLGLFAWLLGTAMAVVVSAGLYDFSVEGIFEVFGTLTAGIFLTFVRLFMKQSTGMPTSQPKYQTWPVAGLAALGIFAVIRYIVFGPGLHL